MASSGSPLVFAGFRFPREVISVAVQWYLRCGLSCLDVEELLAERGIIVDHVTFCRWVQRFMPEFIEAARLARHAPGDRWFADETYVKVAGRWTYLYRVVEQDVGQEAGGVEAAQFARLNKPAGKIDPHRLEQSRVRVMM
jgi:transposase-like protein